MQVARYAEIEWTTGPDGVESPRSQTAATERRPKTLFKPLFRGTPGQPNHFDMIVAAYHAPKYYPRHRHDIDQLRLTLCGVSPWAPGMETPVGSIVYIPAGTYYGPYERPAGLELFAVQFEGANQAPFVDQDSLLAAQNELSQKGRFENGQYVWIGPDGARHEQNGYAAAWTQATGRPHGFPQARFSIPVEINPGSFEWRPIAPGAQVKEFGTFGELGTRLAMLGFDAGTSYVAPPTGQITLGFVTAGAGMADGKPVGERDGLRIEPDDTLHLTAESRLELFVLGLPRLSGALDQEI
jgi:hypothetical protein